MASTILKINSIRSQIWRVSKRKAKAGTYKLFVIDLLSLTVFIVGVFDLFRKWLKKQPSKLGLEKNTRGFYYERAGTLDSIIERDVRIL